MIQTPVNPFPADALETNRRGLLTDAQRQSLTPVNRGASGHDLYVAVFCVVLAVVAWRARVAPGNEWVRPLVAAGALVGAALLVLHPAGPTRRRLRRDVRAGRVQSVQGAITRDRDWAYGGQPRRHYLVVGGMRLPVSRAGYDAAPEAGIVRVYYLPASRHVVNLEQLPDRPVPRELLDSPAEIMKKVSTAIGLHGMSAAADARADLAALAHALAPELAPAGAAPPPDGDPRPLAQAILGSWQSGAVHLTFSPDGTATLAGFIGAERHGRWSVDAAGRLHSNAMGKDGAADAWVTGDVLTISTDGTALTFHRA